MSSTYYMPWPTPRINIRSILDEYAQLASDIGAHYYDTSLVGIIRSSVIEGSSVAPLQISITAQKPTGGQGLRCIHCETNSWSDGLAHWLCKLLDPLATESEVSYKVSFAVRRALQSVPITTPTTISQIDLKDFFLSGDGLT